MSNQIKPATGRYKPKIKARDYTWITNLALLPQGYRRVCVILTDKEYDELMQERIIHAPRGTVSEVIRQRLGWADQPYGFVKAMGKIWRGY